MKVLNKRLVVSQSGATIARGRIYEQIKLSSHKTRLTISSSEGDWPKKIIVPDILLERGSATYRGVEFKIY